MNNESVLALYSTIKFNKMYGVDNIENESEHIIDAHRFDEGVYPANVQCALKRTINLGDFNSVSVQAGVTLPCVVEEIDDAFDKAKEIVKTQAGPAFKKAKQEALANIKKIKAAKGKR